MDSATTSVAIIGMGCRFPGGVTSPESLWSLLARDGDAIVDVPEERWSTKRFYSADPAVPGKTYVRRAGFLRDPIDRFDPLFFGISPREAQHMDPQQRLLLEVAWEAMEDAGVVPSALAGSKTGVYVGGFALDAMTILMSPYGRKNLDSHHTATAASMTMLAARLSYIFDFRGPSVTMDTACSSSLVALHYACRGIIDGECDVAMAGGVNVMLSAEYPIIMSKGHFLAMDGHCKSFDAKADGYSRGEGCGIVLLKRLDHAVRDGDQIHAVVRGTGVNQDGRTDGITVPSADAQESLIRRVYAKAGVPLGKVSYVEAHGTGTPVGDPLEATALGRTIGAGRDGLAPLVIGSVKANIGHLEAAAGIAGVIKTCLCLRHGEVPRQIHLDEPNPAIPFDTLGLKLPLTPLTLAPQGGEPLYAGVNSFGYGGTNAHAILSTLPKPIPAQPENGQSRNQFVLPVSAKTEGALRLMAEAYARALEGRDTAGAQAIAAAAGPFRSHFDHRIAVQGGSGDEIAARLRTFAAEGSSLGVTAGRARASLDSGVVFIFSGMGPQWWGMGQTLLREEPIFRAKAEACDAIFTSLAGWSILAEMQAPEISSRMKETRVAQPANFVLQVAFAALLADLGIQPQAIAGHSVGEVAAAYVSGALSLQDAVRVVYHRSRLQQTTAGTGTMLAAGLSVADATTWLGGYDGLVSIAAVNSAASLTFAGDEAALQAIAAGLEQAGVFHRFLAVEVPYHSPLMDPLRAELEASLDGIDPKTPAIPLYSTVTGARFGGTERHDGAYWFRNLREPVLFADAIGAMIGDGYHLFAEIGPNPVLSSAIRDTLMTRGVTGDTVYALRRKDPETARARTMAAELFTLGHIPDWERLNGVATRETKLPFYQWDRDVYWSESIEGRADRLGAQIHPLLGAPLAMAGMPSWAADLNANYLPWLGDHKIDDAVIFPGAAYVEACLAIHAAHEGGATAIIEHLDLSNALMVDPAAGIELQWSFDPKTRACTAATRPQGHDGAWQTHMSASVLASTPWSAPKRDPRDIAARCTDEIGVTELYQALAARGLNYGPAFQCVRALRRRPGESLARLALGEAEAAEAGTYRIHPSLLDAAFQSLIAACDDTGAGPSLFVPVTIRQILFHAPAGAHVAAHCRLVRQTAELIEGDIVLTAEDGTVCLEVKGICCLAVGRRAGKAVVPLDRWMYHYQWELSEQAVGFADAANWMIFMDESGTGAALARYLRNQGAQRIVEVTAGGAYSRIGDDGFVIRRHDRDDMTALLADARALDCQAIVSLWGADVTLNDAAVDPTGLGALGDVMTLVQRLTALTQGTDKAPRLYIVTRDARHVEKDLPAAGLHQSALIGFTRVAAIEHSELRPTLVDLDAAAAPATAGRRLGQEILSGSGEDDIALRGSNRYVNRLQRRTGTSNSAETISLSSLGRPAAYTLEIAVPGSLDKVRYREVARRAPGEMEVELQIRSAGLNFKDVLKVLGLMSKDSLEGTHYGQTLGMEASALVTAVGPGVTGYKVGDEIVALVAGCIASHVTIGIDQILSVPRPSSMTAAEGATIPITFMTAYYGLHGLARLQRGETILIHAGAGGVGMAAIQVAKWKGATIFATAGTPEKREMLLGLGVSKVWDSRSLEFVDGVMEATNGRGVDVVLNSLSGEAMERSFNVLAPLGRFIEIGKRDIMEKSRLPMAAFDRSVSFSSLDLDRLTLTCQDVILRLFAETWERFEAGDFTALPLKSFPAAKASDALRFMAQAKHIGKVVIDFDDKTDVALVPLATSQDLIRPDATYLVTGAFGGIGMELTRQLAARGARHLVLTGRSGAASELARTMLSQLETMGVDAQEAKLDVSDAGSLHSLVAEIGACMPPLKGVFHAAAVLDDGLISNIDSSRLERVMGPKALGAWLLHEETKHLDLDHFVLFSSATSLIGNPGQAAYVSANTFLDTLARQRRALGLAATAINWGAIGGAGMLAEDNAATRQLELAGVHRIPVAEAMNVLFKILALDPSVVAVMDVDWSAWLSIFPMVKGIPRFSVLTAEASSENAGADYRAALLAVPTAERAPLLTVAILELVAEALHVPAGKIDRRQPLSELGIDSLVGVELQAAINAKLGMQISILQLMKGGNIEEMATLLLQKMNSGPNVTAPPSPSGEPASQAELQGALAA